MTVIDKAFKNIIKLASSYRKKSYFEIVFVVNHTPNPSSMKKRVLVDLGRKSIGMLALLVIGFSAAFAQGLNPSEVPARAKQAFKSSQPAASPTWKAGPKSTYEAHFTSSGRSQVYVYDYSGSLQQKKLKGSINGMPSSVKSQVASMYSASDVKGAYKVMTRSKKKFYEVVVRSGNKLNYMRYTLSGSPAGQQSLVLNNSTSGSSNATASNNTRTEPVVAMRGEASSSNATTSTTYNFNEDLDAYDPDISDLINDPGVNFEFQEDSDWEDVDFQRFEKELWSDDDEDWEKPELVD